MTLVEEQQFKQALDGALAAGKLWVAFDDRPEKELHPSGLRFFSSAADAEEFCDDANGTWDFVEAMFNFNNYHYLSVAGFKKHLDWRLENEMDILKIVNEMAAQNLRLPPGKTVEDLETALKQGDSQPVLLQRQIDPLKEIADYHVIAHRHNGGQVYELGHEHQLLKVFDHYEAARAFMDNAVLFNGLSDQKLDYLLVGRFHNRPLELDMEGYARPHTGLTFLTAHHNYEHGHDYYELQSLSELATVSQYFFAGLDEGKLALFDHKLEPADINRPQQPFYPAYYQHDLLTINNIKSMNEQSFDYVKNQLFYLGFGEEIAKPLREKMEQNLAEFELPHTRKFGQDETHSVLHFSKGDQFDKDMTFFNRADVTLKQPGKDDLTQTFFYGKEFNYTLQERYNMMDGRAAYREQPKVAPVEENGTVRMKPTGETYYAWRGMDFKNADQYGNFNPKVTFWDHEKEMQKYPIKGVEEKYERSRMLRPLERGNKVDVVLLRDGQETPAKMVANPRMLRLDFYDGNGQSLIVRKVEKQAVDQTQKVEMTPQEVQRAAMAKAAEQKQAQGQSQNGTATEQPDVQKETSGPSPDQSQKENTKHQVAAEQQQQEGQRRRQGVRV